MNISNINMWSVVITPLMYKQYNVACMDADGCSKASGSNESSSAAQYMCITHPIRGWLFRDDLPGWVHIWSLCRR